MTWLDRWPDSDHRTRIIFITQGIPRESLKDIVDLLDRVSLRTFKARARGQKALEAARTTIQTEWKSMSSYRVRTQRQCCRNTAANFAQVTSWSRRARKNKVPGRRRI